MGATFCRWGKAKPWWALEGLLRGAEPPRSNVVSLQARAPSWNCEAGGARAVLPALAASPKTPVEAGGSRARLPLAGLLQPPVLPLSAEVGSEEGRWQPLAWKVFARVLTCLFARGGFKLFCCWLTYCTSSQSCDIEL